MSKKRTRPGSKSRKKSSGQIDLSRAERFGDYDMTGFSITRPDGTKVKPWRRPVGTQMNLRERDASD